MLQGDPEGDENGICDQEEVIASPAPPGSGRGGWNGVSAKSWKRKGSEKMRMSRIPDIPVRSDSGIAVPHEANGFEVEKPTFDKR